MSKVHKLCGRVIKDVSLDRTNKMIELIHILHDEVLSGKKVVAIYKGKEIVLNEYKFDLNNLTLRKGDHVIRSYDTLDDEYNCLLFNEPRDEANNLLHYIYSLPNVNNYRYYTASEFIDLFGNNALYFNPYPIY